MVVSGLTPDTKYIVSCAAKNAFGWSDAGQSVTCHTLSDVQVTGTRTQEERDRELMKRAIDVDADTAKKTSKKAKKRR